ncbi:MAG: DUF4386 domain-containing protein [Calditrichaeota bacterium]|nr:MAG: DUF4386 domain-containing protein [Calditrichota bacterium]
MSYIIESQDSKKYAHIAGAFYLLIFLTAGFAEGYVRPSIIVTGDAVTTAKNILENQILFRTAFAADLIAFMSDAIVAVLFYLLFKSVNKPLAILAAVLRLLAHPAIGSINLMNHLSALEVLTTTGSLGLENAQVLAMQFLAAHKTGYLIAGAFFGVQCSVLGYLIVKSKLIPKIIGVLLIIASFGYLIESFGTFLLPEYKDVYSMIVVLPAVVSEGALCLWLLIKGIKSPKE